MDIRRKMLFKTKESANRGSYVVNLNGQWEMTTAITNPNSTLYEGVYRSASNFNVNNGVATMYITITNCASFKMYIRSYAESNYDYVMVSQLDKTINGNTSYSDTTLVKAHTRGNQQSGTALSHYTLVEFTGIPSGEHTITVVYRKDSSVNNGDDRGYVLILKEQEGNGMSGEDDGWSEEGAINTANYLTIEAIEDGLTAKLSVNTCEYCVDGDGKWKRLVANSNTEAINSGHTLSFRGNLTPNSSNGIGTFTISKKCNLKGNCMSMLFGGNAKNNFSLEGKSYAFYKLFSGCTNIVTVSGDFLPAITLADYCYYQMFYNCTSLISAPSLPATTLRDNCYKQMFYGCTSLVIISSLPATTLADHCYYYMFYGCSGLTSAPALPATTLENYCYDSMFRECTSLTSAPELPATTLADYCYQCMFQNCTSLTTTPSLPATTLTKRCYAHMFRDCTSLTTTPELPATTLADNCYNYMFYGCSGLTTAPEILPATTVANYCYEYMFGKCTSLTSAPELPATTLKSSCYNYMFYGCTSLTTAPELPATTLASICYGNMFCNCKSLTTTPELPATKLITRCYESMFYNCTSLTSAPELPATTLANSCYRAMFNGCTSLTTAPELPATILMSSCYEAMFGKCTSLTTTPELPSTTLANSCYSGMFLGCTSLTTTPELPATTLAYQCYYQMFYGCSGLTSAPSLPATTLASWCYFRMFGGCTSLTTAPNLPATTLVDHCYTEMFISCSGLINAPELPVTTLVENCYSGMFGGCTSLTTAPSLPATTLASRCYGQMFEGCTSLTTAPNLPATTLADACYQYMFFECTNLTTAPELPATTLASSCYFRMFEECSNLNYIKMLATDISADQCLLSWVTGVASSGTFVKNKNATWNVTGSSGIPSGWIVVNDGDLITFTIDGTEYQAEEGMTWEEWVNSEYNILNATISGSLIVLGGGWIGNVGKTDVIINGKNYSKSTCCFVAGTMITMSDNTFIPIEDVKIGDMVKTMNINTKEVYNTTVKNTINVMHEHLLDVEFENGSKLTMALYHPLYTTEGWHSYTNHNDYDTLKIGDNVHTVNGYETISKMTIISLDEPVITYNLDVEGNEIDDNFFANGFVAHNAACK